MRLFSTRHSHAELYLHAVWATWNRLAVIDGDLFAFMTQQAAATAGEFGAVVLAFGGVADHVHALLRYRPDLPASELVRALKAALTRCIRRDRPGLSSFAWQAGYGAFSVGVAELSAVKSYIWNQRRHHADGRLWPEVEPVG